MTTPAQSDFTVAGTAAVDVIIRDILDETTAQVRATIPAGQIRALALIGGYGRGEGAVAVDKRGRERPCNNLDLLLVADRLSRPARISDRLGKVLRPLIDRHGIGLDHSVIHATALRWAAPRMIWYDVRYGHRTLLGDERFVPSLHRFTAGRIPAWDARNLLVNRGTLLLINDALLAHPRFDEAWRPMIVRHAMKAVLGYGDALLYFLDQYHWSYVERRARMQRRRDVPASFRALYDEAMAFRFQPDPGLHAGVDLAAWNRDIVDRLRPVHLVCEAARLGIADLSWDRYIEAALRAEALEEPLSGRRWARKLAHAVCGLRRSTSPCALDVAAWLEHNRTDLSGGVRGLLGPLVAGERGLLPLLFPFVLYGFELEDERRAVRRYLGAPTPDTADLREAYLAAWARHGDVNYPTLLDRLGLAENGEEVAA